MEQGPELVRVVDREASPGRQGLTGDAGQGIAERPDSEPVPVQRGDGAFISSGFSPECISLCVVVSESTLKCLDDFYRYNWTRSTKGGPQGRHGDEEHGEQSMEREDHADLPRQSHGGR